jgi:dolichyl-diphosphooligosaccharide---protein glycosyltransferase
VDDTTKMVLTIIGWIGVMYLTYHILWSAYKIRLQAIEEYGPVIHEFDPYFNYRATEVRDENDVIMNTC